MRVSSLNFQVATKAEVESTKRTSPVPGRRRGSKVTDAGRTCRSTVAPPRNFVGAEVWVCSEDTSIEHRKKMRGTLQDEASYH